ncbi:stemmadenine O-acetyltransferase-like [Punica granatum]|uniref:Stemmadenine O-acetyltransferase-like n=1 Tax=Punica granatum TaxID=22663 RepID=A0A6P8BRM9_PUNGR|nr:stemmadenine O-acetyltransferase-like [Punica granatum]
MDVLKIEIVSKERIKPSSSTPTSLRNFQLSLLDQLSPPEYVPMIFYYAPPDGTGCRLQARSRIDCLKHSLSLTLAKFYPLAGRVRENRFIECDDDGVDFFEAESSLPLSEVLRQPSAEVMDQLLPSEYHSTTSSHDREVQLATQANVFTCGGIAIGICVLHKIVDGITFTSLMNSWAANSRGSGDPSSSPLFVGPSLFPQRDLSGLLPTLDIPRDKCVTKRFVFGESKIALLRDKLKEGRCIENPSRVEAVSALIWRCAINVNWIRKGSLIQSVLTQTVNLRARMDPPLPENCVGNILWLAIAPAPEIEPRAQEVELHELVNQIRRSINKFDAEHIRKMQGNSGFSVIIESLKQVVELVSRNVDIYRFTSLGRLRLYEADFGWGKPVWVSSAGLAFKNVVVLIETRDSKGIEAWVTLEEGDMAIFERDREILSFASTNSSASCLLLNPQL